MTIQKNQVYIFKGIEVPDATVPSIGSEIKIIKAKGNKIEYEVLKGNPSVDGKDYFYRGSDMSNNLVFVR